MDGVPWGYLGKVQLGHFKIRRVGFGNLTEFGLRGKGVYIRKLEAGESIGGKSYQESSRVLVT